MRQGCPIIFVDQARRRNQASINEVTMMRPRPSWNISMHLCRRTIRYRTFAWKSEAEGASSATNDDSKLNLLKSTAKKTTPKLLFPWHHSSDHPRRLAEREANFSEGISYHTSCKIISALTARAHLKVPLWNVLLGAGWSQDLADSCSWAFLQSVAGILTNTYDGTCRMTS